MDVASRALVVLLSILFIMNMGMALFNVFHERGKAWLAVVNLAAAFFVGFSVVNTLAEM